MPYGVRGGDTAASSAAIEKCVAALVAQGKPKIRAIMICKAQYQKTHRKG